MHELRRLNDEVNERIARLAGGERVVFLDLGDRFPDVDGISSEKLMPDLLHPNERGYRLWAETSGCSANGGVSGSGGAPSPPGAWGRSGRAAGRDPSIGGHSERSDGIHAPAVRDVDGRVVEIALSGRLDSVGRFAPSE